MDIKKEDLIPDSTLDKDGDNMQRGVTNMPPAQNTSGKTEDGDEDYDDEITDQPPAPATKE